MKTYPLDSLEDWDDIEAAAKVLEAELGWKICEKVEGPDARGWTCSKGDLRLVLVYDDMLGLSFKSDSNGILMKKIQAYLIDKLAGR